MIKNYLDTDLLNMGLFLVTVIYKKWNSNAIIVNMRQMNWHLKVLEMVVAIYFKQPDVGLKLILIQSWILVYYL